MNPAFVTFLKKHAATVYGLAVIAMVSIEVFLFYGNVGTFTPFTIVYAVCETALIFAPYWWLKGRWRMAAIVPVWLISAYVAVNIWYLRFWGYTMPLELASQVGNAADGVIIDSTLGVLSPLDIIFILIPVAATVPWFLSRAARVLSAQRIRIQFRLCATVVSCLLYAAVFQAFVLHTYQWKYPGEKVRFCKFLPINKEIFTNPFLDHNRHIVVIHAGFIKHVVADISNCMSSNKILLPNREEKESIDRYLSSRVHERPTESTPQRNLIFIVVESLNADALHLSDSKGRGITPVLDSLANADGSISCLRMRPQVAGGNSSDGQLMYNLGTLPTISGVAVYSFVPKMKAPPTLPSLLPEAYPSYAIFADDGNTWGKTKTYEIFGYDSIFTSKDIERAVPGPVSADGAMLRFALDRARKLPQPFYMQLLTIQMHAPYKTDGMEQVDFSGTGLSESRQRYLTCTADFDRHLGRFLQGLRECGLADNTIVVIASDHNAPGTTKADGSRADIVFIATNTGRTLHIEEPVHQTDVFPTVLDLTGVRSVWRGVGHSMLGPRRGESDSRQATVCDSILRSGYFPQQ